MNQNKQPKMVTKEWSMYFGEDGAKVLDLEIFDPSRSETPIVAVYGLSFEAVAMGVLARKSVNAVPVREYINNLVAPMEYTQYDSPDELTTFH